MEIGIRRQNVKIPNSITILFLIIECLFGLSFGFSKFAKNRLQPVLKCLNCLSFVIIMSTLISIFVDLQLDIIYFYSFDILTCAIFFVFSLFSKYNLCDFLMDICIITKELKPKFIILTVGITFAFYILKTAVLIYTCFNREDRCFLYDDTLPRYIYNIVAGSAEFLSVVNITISYYIYFCVKELKYSLNTLNNLKIASRYYTNIADCVDRVKPLFSLLVSNC